MGSALLYLAIVVMWLGVLVPMWLRRDRDIIDDLHDEEPAFEEADTLIERKPLELSGATDAAGPADYPTEDAPVLSGASEAVKACETPEASDASDATEASEASEALEASEAQSGVDAKSPTRSRQAQWRRRARIVARRRRRLLWSALLLLASVVTAAVGIVPWWGLTPAGLLLVAYVAVLRAAVKIDRDQREAAVIARAERLRGEREHRRAVEAMAREAEIIQLEERRRGQVFDQYADTRRAVGD